MLKLIDSRFFHAHPYSRNERPKYDWVLVKWSEFDNPVPAKVEMFLDFRSSSLKFDNTHIVDPDRLEDGTNDIPLLHTTKILTKSIYTVVCSAQSTKCSRTSISKYHLPTCLCYRLKMERFYRLVEVTPFEEKCFVFMTHIGGDEQCDNTAIVFHPPDKWGDIFLKGCRPT